MTQAWRNPMAIHGSGSVGPGRLDLRSFLPSRISEGIFESSIEDRNVWWMFDECWSELDKTPRVFTLLQEYSWYSSIEPPMKVTSHQQNQAEFLSSLVLIGGEFCQGLFWCNNNDFTTFIIRFETLSRYTNCVHENSHFLANPFLFFETTTECLFSFKPWFFWQQYCLQQIVRCFYALHFCLRKPLYIVGKFNHQLFGEEMGASTKNLPRNLGPNRLES